MHTLTNNRLATKNSTLARGHLRVYPGWHTPCNVAITLRP